MSDTKALSKFNAGLKSALLESLKACMEAPDDEEGNPDWTAYDDFIEHAHTNVINHARELAANLEAEHHKVSGKAMAGGKAKKPEKGGTRKNTYTRFVRVASQIRKGAIDSEQEFVVGDNFRDKSTASASKYLAMKGDLGLDGRSMTVKFLLDTLKECMPDEKDLTLTAICWGLMPKEFRDSLVEELDTAS
jgi:hypothetical protein